MRRLRVLAAIVLLGCAAVAGWAYGQPNSSSSAAVLTAQDHAAIGQLYARYNQGVDFRDADMWLSVFADDGVFQFRDEKYEGQQELAEYRAKTFARTAGGPDIRHWNGSIVVTPTPDGVEGRAYWIMVDVSSAVPTEVASGHYDDVFVKTPDGWRIKVRTGYSDPRRAATQ